MAPKFLPVLAILALLAACTGLPGGDAALEGTPKPPETLLADGDAALERNELPEAARAYRLAAEASEDETMKPSGGADGDPDHAPDADLGGRRTG